METLVTFSVDADPPANPSRMSAEQTMGPIWPSSPRTCNTVGHRPLEVGSSLGQDTVFNSSNSGPSWRPGPSCVQSSPSPSFAATTTDTQLGDPHLTTDVHSPLPPTSFPNGDEQSIKFSVWETPVHLEDTVHSSASTSELCPCHGASTLDKSPTEQSTAESTLSMPTHLQLPVQADGVGNGKGEMQPAPPSTKKGPPSKHCRGCTPSSRTPTRDVSPDSPLSLVRAPAAKHAPQHLRGTENHPGARKELSHCPPRPRKRIPVVTLKTPDGREIATPKPAPGPKAPVYHCAQNQSHHHHQPKQKHKSMSPQAEPQHPKAIIGTKPAIIEPLPNIPPAFAYLVQYLRVRKAETRKNYMGGEELFHLLLEKEPSLLEVAGVKDSAEYFRRAIALGFLTTNKALRLRLRPGLGDPQATPDPSA